MISKVMDTLIQAYFYSYIDIIIIRIWPKERYQTRIGGHLVRYIDMIRYLADCLCNRGKIRYSDDRYTAIVRSLKGTVSRDFRHSVFSSIDHP
jgi:hypothetical protein